MLKVLMVGPARSVKGGMTTVVDNYYKAGLDKRIELKYIESINDKGKISKFLQELKGMKEFKKNLKDYDAVHIHVASRRSTFRKGKYVRLAKKYNKKVILHVHGAEYQKFYNECNDKQKEYVRETLNMCDKIIVLSEEWFDYFKTLTDGKKLVVIYNSIVLPKDFEKNINSNEFLFLGRIGHRKGIYDLLDVFEELVKDFKDIKLYVGGDGEVEKLQNLIKEKQLENVVEYIGWTSGENKEKYLRDCSFYILPSYNEGMPMSVLEGMAYKNVTLSTYVGGIPKVIQNLENGIIINPGDKESMYNYLKQLLQDENLRRKLSNNARKTIEEKFNNMNVIKSLIQLYRQIKGDD